MSVNCWRHVKVSRSRAVLTLNTQSESDPISDVEPTCRRARKWVSPWSYLSLFDTTRAAALRLMTRCSLSVVFVHPAQADRPRQYRVYRLISVSKHEPRHYAVKMAAAEVQPHVTAARPVILTFQNVKQ